MVAMVAMAVMQHAIYWATKLYTCMLSPCIIPIYDCSKINVYYNYTLSFYTSALNDVRVSSNKNRNVIKTEMKASSHAMNETSENVASFIVALSK